MYVLVALILLAVVLATRLASRFSVPLIVIALGVGIVFGSDVTGLIWFGDMHLANQLANAALVFVLFAGGFGTQRESLRLTLVPSMTMATAGVLVTAAITAVLAWQLLGFPLEFALLIGAIISSTDAAAVFSILRTRSLEHRVSATTEIESAANDPMAIISTTLLVAIASQGGHEGPWWSVGVQFLWQLAGGVGLGLGIGWTGVKLFRFLAHVDRAYFYVLLVGVILLSFGLADLLKASGMLAAFFAGFVLGNAKIPFRNGVETFLEALSTIANVGLFVLLGLLVFPKEFAHIWLQGVGVFVILTFVARPLAVWLGTLWTKEFGWRHRVFLSWAGIRGAVPIVLATYPAAAGLEGGKDIFNIVFFAVALSVLFQGTTIGKLADWLGLSLKAKPRPRQAMELVTFQDSDLELCEWSVPEEGTRPLAVSSLDLPKGTTITMINRKEQIIAPRGTTVVEPGDVLYVLLRSEDRKAVEESMTASFGGGTGSVSS